MSRTITLIAVTGITTAAFGQGFSLSTSEDVLAPGDTVTITMSFNNGNKVIAAGIFNFNADQEFGVASAGTWNFPGTFALGGTPTGASLEGVRYVQAPNNNDTRGDVFSFEWTSGLNDFGIVTIELEGFNVLEGDLGAFAGSAAQASGSVTLFLIPTPASTAVLALGGLVAARRRR